MIHKRCQKSNLKEVSSFKILYCSNLNIAYLVFSLSLTKRSTRSRSCKNLDLEIEFWKENHDYFQGADDTNDLQRDIGFSKFFISHWFIRDVRKVIKNNLITWVSLALIWGRFLPSGVPPFHIGSQVSTKVILRSHLKI